MNEKQLRIGIGGYYFDARLLIWCLRVAGLAPRPTTLLVI